MPIREATLEMLTIRPRIQCTTPEHLSESLGEEEQTAHIDVEHRVHLLGGLIERWGSEIRPGAVDQDVGGLPLRRHGVDQGIDFVDAREVGRHRRPLAVVFSDPFDRGFDLVFGPRNSNDVRAGLREANHDPFTDTPTGTRNDCSLSAQLDSN